MFTVILIVSFAANFLSKTEEWILLEFLNRLKPEYCQDEAGELPNQKLWDDLQVP